MADANEVSTPKRDADLDELDRLHDEALNACGGALEDIEAFSIDDECFDSCVFVRWPVLSRELRALRELEAATATEVNKSYPSWSPIVEALARVAEARKGAES